DPASMFAVGAACLLSPGCAGNELYAALNAYPGVPNNPVNFNTGFSINSACNQQGFTNPRWLSCNNPYNSTANSMTMKLGNFMTRSVFGQRASARDWGQSLSTAVRLGCSAGTALLVEAWVNDSTRTATIPLTGAWTSSCGGGGNNFVVYSASWQGFL